MSVTSCSESYSMYVDGTGQRLPYLPAVTRLLGDLPLQEAWTNLGSLLRDWGKGEKALGAFDNALSLDTAYVHAYHLRGLCKHGMGDHKGAQADFMRGLFYDAQVSAFFAQDAAYCVNLHCGHAKVAPINRHWRQATSFWRRSATGARVCVRACLCVGWYRASVDGVRGLKNPWLWTSYLASSTHNLSSSLDPFGVLKNASWLQSAGLRVERPTCRLISVSPMPSVHFFFFFVNPILPKCDEGRALPLHGCTLHACPRAAGRGRSLLRRSPVTQAWAPGMVHERVLRLPVVQHSAAVARVFARR